MKRTIGLVTTLLGLTIVGCAIDESRGIETFEHRAGDTDDVCDNNLTGSIDESLPLAFDTVVIYKQESTLRIEYLKLIDGGAEKTLKLVVDTSSLELSDGVTVNNEQFLNHVLVERVAVTGGNFPPIAEGTVHFDLFDFRDGGRITGDFVINFDTGHNLSGRFCGEAVDIILEEWLGERTHDGCAESIPACPATIARCELDGSDYTIASLPADSPLQVLVTTEGPATIQVSLYATSFVDGGLDTRIHWYEPGCADRYDWESFAPAVFQGGVLTQSMAVFEAGQHLIELFSDMEAEVMVKATVL